MAITLIIILFAVALDRFFPDRGRAPPFLWYEDWARSVEQRFNAGTRGQGLAAVLVVAGPVILGVALIRYILSHISYVLVYIFDILVLYLCLDLYRLTRQAVEISESLESGDVLMAATHLEAMTGKTTADVTESSIAQTTVEAVLKHANTAVMAPLFWFILFGPVAVVLQRLTALLDRLWGHRSAQFAEFGWAAARLNDLLGWVPARITALSYGIMGSFEDALHCWRRQAGMWSDINSGPLLASGFGAMHMSACEEPEEEDTPGLPAVRGIVVNAADIRRAVALLWRVLLFWLAVALLMAGARLFGVFG
ncbi:regulatory signaling modulator protein AmpE [Acidiferrobacter sp.]|jgi:adenosylcobinamide-phosphate synthase|uniref:cobalamin biosynthesis protein CobD/CbiB n=1 Tax=Acidiferrobacter sp. TaxID=1872107 RepID=UPI0026156E69|nr:regulatory signaling modulator protein AmpE [Acidiferrobacter sp.]